MSRREGRDFVPPARNARPGAGSATPAPEFPDGHPSSRPVNRPVAARLGPRTTRGAERRRSAPTDPAP